jgi:hypothetical protein
MVRQFHQLLADVVDVDHHRKFQMDYFRDALAGVVDVVRLVNQMDYCQVYLQDVEELEKEYLLVAQAALEELLLPEELQEFLKWMEFQL